LEPCNDFAGTNSEYDKMKHLLAVVRSSSGEAPLEILSDNASPSEEADFVRLVDSWLANVDVGDSFEKANADLVSFCVTRKEEYIGILLRP